MEAIYVLILLTASFLIAQGIDFSIWWIRRKLIPGIQLWILIFKTTKVFRRIKKDNPEDRDIDEGIELCNKLLKSPPWIEEDKEEKS